MSGGWSGVVVVARRSQKKNAQFWWLWEYSQVGPIYRWNGWISCSQPSQPSFLAGWLTLKPNIDWPALTLAPAGLQLLSHLNVSKNKTVQSHNLLKYRFYSIIINYSPSSTE